MLHGGVCASGSVKEKTLHMWWESLICFVICNYMDCSTAQLPRAFKMVIDCANLKEGPKHQASFSQVRLAVRRTFCRSHSLTLFYCNQCSLEHILRNDHSICPVRGNR